MGPLTRVERAFESMMKLFEPKNFHPIDLCRLALHGLEGGCRKGLRRTYAPNTFIIQLHRTDYQELYPFLKVITQEITTELQQAINTRNYVLAGDLEVVLRESAQVKEGVPEVQAVVRSEAEPDSVVCDASLSDDPRVDWQGDAPVAEDPTAKATSPIQEFADLHHQEEAYTVVMEEGKTIVGERNFTDDDVFHQPHHISGSAALTVKPAAGRDVTPFIANSSRPSGSPGEIILQTNIPGVSLLIDNGRIQLENCMGYEKVAVDGMVQPLCEVKKGSIGPLELHFSA